MATNLEECPTGILIDFSNATVSAASENNFNSKVCSLEAKCNGNREERASDIQTPLIINNSCTSLVNNCLGADLATPEDVMSNLRAGWRTPSPTTMDIISEEAFRIADELDTLETSIWDEKFPSEDECFGSSSNRVQISHDLTSEIDHKSLSYNVNRLEENIMEHKLKTECFSSNEGGYSLNQEHCSNTSENEYSNCKETKFFEVNETGTTKENDKVTVKLYGITTEASCATVENVCGEPMEEVTEKHTEDEAEKSTEETYGEETKRDCGELKEKVSVKLDEVSVTPEKELSEKPDEENKSLEDKSVCILEKTEGSTETHINGNTSKCSNCDKVIIEKNVTMIEKSYLATAKNAMDKGSGIFEIEHSSPIAKDSNVKESKAVDVFENDENMSIAEAEQRHLFSESYSEVKNNKSTPSKLSSMKSKIIKVLKDSTSKTPKCSKEKENMFYDGKDKNILPVKKSSKVGQISSKSVLGESNVNKSRIMNGSSNIATPLTKRIFGKKGENKSNKSMAQDPSQDTVKRTPLKNSNFLKCPAATTPLKTPLCKSYSMITNSKTPNMANGVRRSNSFQTNSAKNSIPMKREKTFAANSQLKTLNSSILNKTSIGNEFKTPSKLGSFLPKSSSKAYATPSSKVSQIARPSFGSALKPINVPVQQLIGTKRPVSTTCKTRFLKKLELPLPLPDNINDNLSRQLFPDNTPKKRYN